jgi:alpha-ketoglutarate-dependent taurine dioxygenase
MLETRDLKPLIGSEVKADKQTLLSGRLSQEIKDLLVKRGVIVIRDMPLNDEELQAFGRTMGAPTETQGEKIYKVTMDASRNEKAAILYGTRAWHMDRLDTPLPPLGTILSPRVLSPEGGETEFANTYAAYEDLPEDEKRRLERLVVTHSLNSQFRAIADLPEGFDFAQVEATGFSVDHPLVWRHRSGRKSLIFAKTAEKVVGMDKAESDALIARLMDWVEQPQYVYRHHWRMGDIVMWDNTGTMHRVLPFDVNSGRELHRITIEGIEPLPLAA